jgi:hypothetical protein
VEERLYREAIDAILDGTDPNSSQITEDTVIPQGAKTALEMLN